MKKLVVSLNSTTGKVDLISNSNKINKRIKAIVANLQDEEIEGNAAPISLGLMILALNSLEVKTVSTIGKESDYILSHVIESKKCNLIELLNKAEDVLVCKINSEQKEIFCGFHDKLSLGEICSCKEEEEEEELEEEELEEEELEEELEEEKKFKNPILCVILKVSGSEPVRQESVKQESARQEELSPFDILSLMKKMEEFENEKRNDPVDNEEKCEECLAKDFCENSTLRKSNSTESSSFVQESNNSLSSEDIEKLLNVDESFLDKKENIQDEKLEKRNLMIDTSLNRTINFLETIIKNDKDNLMSNIKASKAASSSDKYLVEDYINGAVYRTLINKNNRLSKEKTVKFAQIDIEDNDQDIIIKLKRVDELITGCVAVAKDETIEIHPPFILSNENHKLDEKIWNSELFYRVNPIQNEKGNFKRITLFFKQ